METIQIKDPVYAEMTVHKDRTDIQFVTADGIKEFSVPISESSEVQTLNFSIGDTSGIGWGGTDNWGKDVYPIELGYQQGSNEGDSVFVDTIDIQEVSDWCKCELVNNGKAVRYTALSENSSKDVRTAYFVHKTTDDTIKRGYAIGRPAAKSWYVTVTQDGNPNARPGPEPTPPELEPTGRLTYD